MKRVLVVAYLFPPIANSGTQRPLKFTKYLRGHGWMPTVLTAAAFEGHATDAALLQDIPPDIEVERVPMLHQSIDRGLRRALGPAVGGAVGSAIGWRVQHRWRTPDWYALWRPAVTRAARRIFRERGFDAIYATGFPWTSLLAGADIAEATGRPLIADFRDLWAGETGFREHRPPHDDEVALERRVVDEAHTVVGASTSIVRSLRDAHPHAAPDKFVAIHNGFDAADLQPRPERSPGRPFRIVYTGVWKDGYNPVELYDSVEWLHRATPRSLDGVEVIAAGFPPGEAHRRGLSSIITELGLVPHRQALELMQSADLLYLSHSAPDRQWAVPGKVYEYLASGSPVLALTHPEKETAQIINAVGGGIVVSPDDPGTLYEALGKICRARAFLVPARNAAVLATFERQALTARLAAVLDEAYTTRRSRAGSTDAPTRSSYAGSTSAQPATRVVS